MPVIDLKESIAGRMSLATPAHLIERLGIHQQQQIIDTTIPPSDSRGPAIVVTPNLGNYTEIVPGEGDTTGTASSESTNWSNEIHVSFAFMIGC
jgi:hypothetical protein